MIRLLEENMREQSFLRLKREIWSIKTIDKLNFIKIENFPWKWK